MASSPTSAANSGVVGVSRGLHAQGDLYDIDRYVTPTIAKLTEFYAVKLAELAIA
jgi:hypothetical protein